MKLLSSLFSRTPRGAPFPEARPDAPFSAIGDIHGRADLLERLLDKITTPQLVLVGDYIDRGEDSARVLRVAQALTETHGDAVVCLKGNHEHMALRFLEDPERAGPRWLRNGGLQTLASYGIGGLTELSGDAALTAARDAFAEALGAPAIAWLRDLPLIWRSGNLAVVHAGADPALPFEDQDDRTLIWGHADFLRKPRTDGLWVVHGHTIVDAPLAAEGRIAIDTGAYATGTLTAVQVFEDRVEFLQA